MANESVLRSYLISLGYAIDEDGYKKFRANLQDTSKKMQELGLVAIAAATELTASVLKIASNLERLYFASQRTGATAKNIQALEFGAQQIGVSADEARGALESMAAALRTSPGLIGYLRALNINPNQDGVNLLITLVDRLRRMPFYQAASIASMFGIDEKTLFMMEKNFDELKKQMEESRRVNPIDDEKIKKFHEFMERVRDVTNKLEILANVVATRFVPILNTMLPYISAFLDKLIALDAATGGWSSVLIGLATALGSVLGAATALRALGGFLGLGGTAEGAGVLAMVRGIAVWLTTIGSAAAVAGITAVWLTTKRWHEELAGIQIIYHNLGDYLKHPVNTIKTMFSENGQDSPEQKAIRHLVHTLFPSISENLPGQAATTAPPVTGGYGVPLHNPGNLRHWPGVPEVNRGGKLGSFANFATDQEGLNAMAQNLLTYSRHGLNTLNSIISTWAPSSENNTAAYIADISKKMGVGAGSTLDLTNPGTLTELMKDMIHHEQGRDPYNSKLISDAATYRLSQGQAGGSTVTINQDTKIDIDGSGDPKSVGDQVLRGQRSVNADIVRNVGGNHR
jgi:hypothetical protein